MSFVRPPSRSWPTAHHRGRVHVLLPTMLSWNHLSDDVRDLAILQLQSTIILSTYQRCWRQFLKRIVTYDGQVLQLFLPSHAVYEKGHTTRHCSRKLHTSKMMTSSLECCTKTCIKKTCIEQSTNVLFFYSFLSKLRLTTFWISDDDDDVWRVLCAKVFGVTSGDGFLDSFFVSGK